MSFLSLTGVELKKIRRSGILWILVIPVFLIWLTSVINADINFTMGNEGISPENNFFIQSFMGYAWFMYPASIVISTVMLIQTERRNRGILKMLALPVSAARLCLAKFCVLLLLAAAQMLFMTLAYFPSAAIASHTQGYDFMLPVIDILREAGTIYISSIPMAAFFWLLAVCIRTPIFSIGVGMASIVPSVLLINTKIWFAYPMCYPFLMTASRMHELASNMGTFAFELIPFIPAAVGITVVSLFTACICFGQAERR